VYHYWKYLGTSMLPVHGRDGTFNHFLYKLVTRTDSIFSVVWTSIMIFNQQAAHKHTQTAFLILQHVRLSPP